MSLRALVLSDLHLEFSDSEFLEREQTPPYHLKEIPGQLILPPMPNPSTYDIIILAGDICQVNDNLYDYLEFLNQFGRPVLFIPGNHEYYYATLFGVLSETIEPVLKQRQLCNIHLLNRKSVEISGIRFIGATLWSNWGCDCYTENEIDSFVEQHREIYPPSNLSDFSCIHTPDTGCLTLTQQLLEYKKDHDFIEDELSAYAGMPCVVITHHSPSNAKLNASDGWSKSTPQLVLAYSSDLDDLIQQTQPLLWCHGHIHSSLDYTMGKTRLVCNPRGYVGHFYYDEGNKRRYRSPRTNPSFDPQKIIELAK